MAGASSRRSHDAPGHRWATVEFPAVFAQALSTVIFLPRPLATVVPGLGDSLGLRVERYLEGKVQILGVSVEPPEKPRNFSIA